MQRQSASGNQWQIVDIDESGDQPLRESDKTTEHQEVVEAERQP